MAEDCLYDDIDGPSESAANRASKSSISFYCACDIAGAAHMPIDPTHMFDDAAPIIAIPYSSLGGALLDFFILDSIAEFISMQSIASLIISDYMDILALF